MAEPTSPRPPRDEDQTLGRVLVEDLQQMRLGRDYVRELRQLYYFYLDDDRRGRLAAMGRVRRAFSLIGWLLWSMYIKLSPPRRLMVGAATLCTIAGVTTLKSVTIDFRPTGFVLLLIVLMLELKDKLLAKDEIAIAREVQLALLPRRHPEIPGWQVWTYSRPANDVGGDLVDYVDIDGFRHGVLLGDVSGKGLGAALLSAKLQATIRAVLPDAGALDDLGRRVNRIFYNEALDNRYATLFFAQLEHDSRELRFLNAGHNPAFVIRPEGLTKLGASSFPLGMLASADYAEGLVELEGGDILLAYSDGLTEATNDRGEEFGLVRLEALLPGLRGLSPEQAGKHLLEAVDAFLGDARASDDLSLAIIVKH